MMNNKAEYQPGPYKPRVPVPLLYNYDNDNPIELPIKLC